MEIIDALLKIVHVFVCLVLMFVVLLQQGRGGGLGAAFGGGAAAQVFGGRGAGNILTRATAVCAATFMITSVALAYRSSSADRALQTRIELEKQRKAEKGTHHVNKEAPAPPTPPATTSEVPAPTTTTTITLGGSSQAPTESAPAPTAPAPATSGSAP